MTNLTHVLNHFNYLSLTVLKGIFQVNLEKYNKSKVHTQASYKCTHPPSAQRPMPLQSDKHKFIFHMVTFSKEFRVVKYAYLNIVIIYDEIN